MRSVSRKWGNNISSTSNLGRKPLAILEVFKSSISLNKRKGVAFGVFAILFCTFYAQYFCASHHIEPDDFLHNYNKNQLCHGKKCIRGVSKLLSHQIYKHKEGFHCPKGDPNILLPLSRINDDYCDCDFPGDGFDEPGTAACAHLSTQGFYCQRDGDYVHSSVVRDGIPDCCDGEDEWSEDNPPENFENFCEDDTSFDHYTHEIHVKPNFGERLMCISMGPLVILLILLHFFVIWMIILRLKNVNPGSAAHLAKSV
eukprot:GCRY01003836.1.p1 GENE.GCRY01003836.1~~GCRY01003836.1.p1  ORF type:complete len:256 (+),score=6.79 GCRY01003836.1:283-1050(+)